MTKITIIGAAETELFNSAPESKEFYCCIRLGGY